MNRDLSRRTFVKTVGEAGLAALAGCSKKEAKIRNQQPAMVYREVGRTGIKVSVFSLGTGECKAEILAAALDRGVNLFHTAADYMKGKSQEILGQVIKGRREQVNIALKDDFDDISTAFQTLGVSQVEFLMFNRHNPDKFRTGLPDIIEKFKTWRDKGLVKFAGLTTHKNVSENLNLALEAGIFSCFMPSLTPPELVSLKPQLDAARRKGISIIGMKTKGELDGPAYEKHLPVLLAEPAVAAAFKSVQTIEDLEAWAGAAAAAARPGAPAPAAGGMAYRGCGLCGRCEAACPHGVAAADAVRCIRYYHDAERLPAMARREFARLDLALSLAQCEDCGACERACPRRVPVRRELRRAWEMWAV